MPSEFSTSLAYFGSVTNGRYHHYLSGVYRDSVMLVKNSTEQRFSIHFSNP